MAIRKCFGLLCAAGLLAVAFSGCNTVGGMGEDIRSLGSSMERSADRHGAD